MNQKNGARAPRGSAFLEKATALLLALQPAGADLVLMVGLEMLLWIA